MTGQILTEMLQARQQRRPHFLITLAATRGSVPRQAGTKMLLYPDGLISGTIGGGKFESLVIAEALALPRRSPPLLRTYPLHEASPDSFGAVCGGEVTVLIEPQLPPPSLTLVGAGHCSRALASLASICGWYVIVLDDRPVQLLDFPAQEIITTPAPAYIAARLWQEDDALVLISHHYQVDRAALAAALRHRTMAYLGMIGSQRKVHRVLTDLLADGFTPADFHNLRAPLGLDLGADHPNEIALSILAEILTVFNHTSGLPLAFNVSTLTATPAA